MTAIASLPSLIVLTLSWSAIVAVLIAWTSWDAVLTQSWWIVAQLPLVPPPLRNMFQQTAWQRWEQHQRIGKLFRPVPVRAVNVQHHLHDLPAYLAQTFGVNWQREPLLLQNLWTAAELSRPDRLLSVHGLMQVNMTVPYFSDARQANALTPDRVAPLSDIVRGISAGHPHKIGSQLLLQARPELIAEVAPTALVTELFGDYFTPARLRGTGPWQLLPAFTTVPLFVANSAAAVPPEDATNAEHAPTQQQQQPYTALHCEPIGNLAVQLVGAKRWTLAAPGVASWLRPSMAPDGRAFFFSHRPLTVDHAATITVVPVWQAVTRAGDAMWVPTWTWHRVDYYDDANQAAAVPLEASSVALGASLFHFRFNDFVRNNPLYALLLLPAIVCELIGLNTQ